MADYAFEPTASSLLWPSTGSMQGPEHVSPTLLTRDCRLQFPNAASRQQSAPANRQPEFRAAGCDAQTRQSNRSPQVNGVLLCRKRGFTGALRWLAMPSKIS